MGHFRPTLARSVNIISVSQARFKGGGGGGDGGCRCRNCSQATLGEVPPLHVSEHSCVFTWGLSADQTQRSPMQRLAHLILSLSLQLGEIVVFLIVGQETSSG